MTNVMTFSESLHAWKSTTSVQATLIVYHSVEILPGCVKTTMLIPSAPPPTSIPSTLMEAVASWQLVVVHPFEYNSTRWSEKATRILHDMYNQNKIYLDIFFLVQGHFQLCSLANAERSLISIFTSIKLNTYIIVLWGKYYSK